MRASDVASVEGIGEEYATPPPGRRRPRSDAHTASAGEPVTESEAPEVAARGKGRRALILVEDLPVPFDRRVWTESKTLRDAGWKVTVISPKGEGGRRWHERFDGIEIFRYPLPTTAAGFLNHLAEYAVAVPASLILALLAWRGRRFDVVHACNPPDFFFPIGWLFQRLGAAFVFDQHDLSPEVYVAQGGRRGGLVHRILLWCERRTYRTADVVIATNETYRRFALERGGVDPERVFVVRSSPDPARIHRVDEDPSLRDGRAQLVAYLGTMGSQDGVELFVEAAQRIVAERPDQVRFIAMGGGPQLDPLREQIREKGLDADVLFTGRVPDEYVRRVLSTTDVAISPDPANDFNEFCTMNKTLEYMAVGVPVVAFDLEENRVSAGDAAAYARPNESSHLAELVMELLDQPERRARMGEVGMDRIAGDLSWAHSARTLLAAYDQAVDR
jgi:glycosyltransferase involved in cell wall biosynthesis